MDESGDPEEMYRRGVRCWQRGREVEAETSWRRAAEGGHVDSMKLLALLLDREDRLVRIFRSLEAETWWRAADAGDLQSMHYLGRAMWHRGLLDDGQGWTRRAAEAGYVPAMADLGDALVYRAFYEGPAEEALEWYQRGAEAGDAEAMYSLGAQFDRQGQTADAEHWFRRAADAGHERARLRVRELSGELDDPFAHYQAQVEEATAEGEGSELDQLRRDFVTIEDDRPDRPLRAAADAGDADAMYRLAKCLEERGRRSEGGPWLRRAVDAGDADAMFELGLWTSVNRRDEDAERWYQRAFAAGRSDTKTEFGALLMQRGRKKDAERW
jgi:TPR repeat protein